jgi:DNA (cytosine-5)-methyltransferase 1
MTKQPVAVDLFCGAGGLTRGLQKAGFRVAVGVELDGPSARTYALNNREAKTFNTDIRRISATEVSDALPGKVALLAACPPCQGFTSLTSKHRRDDPRNDLASEVIRFARKLKPASVMFENVPRFLTSKRGKKRFDGLIMELESLGYVMSWEVLQAADFGTAQMRRRLVVFGAHKQIDAPSPTHAKNAVNGLKPWRTVEDVIGREREAEVYDRDSANKRKTLADWHVIRKLSPINQARINAAKPGAPRWDLPDRLRPACHKGSSSGFANVYGRMVWDSPSPTITGGCTSPSKGRFGHPEHDRTISAMEAAMLQDFPKGHLIASDSIDDTCEMIGNAFPSRLARAAASQVMKLL